MAQSTNLDSPKPWLKLRLAYAMWKSCSDWETRGSLIRSSILKEWKSRNGNG